MRALMLSAALLFAATTAHAKDFEVGKTYPLATFVCDTQEQMTEVVSAHSENGLTAATLIAQQYMRQRNAQGEAVCGNVRLVMTVVSLIKSYSVEYQGNVVDAHLCEFRAGNRTFYGLISGGHNVVVGSAI